MRRLAGASELLDGPLDDPAMLRGNLRDLVRINVRLGGTSASRRAVDRLLDHRHGSQTLLDVGTGAADIPVALVRAAASNGRSLLVTAVDSRQEVLDAARDVNRRLDAMTAVELVLGDGRSLPWPDRSFDVVHASLVLHHLEPREAVAFLTEASRLARRGVVVNDVVRARRHWLAARVLLALMTRNRYTRHDGPLSVRRAYTRVELRALLAAAGLRPMTEVTAIAGHRVAIAAVPIPPGNRRPPRRHRGGADPAGDAVTAPRPSVAARAPRAVDVAVIGGGPAGAATAARLAAGGHEVVLLERSRVWRWHAGGVFASPAALAELRAVGLPAAALARVARPIPAMRVETPAGTAFELTYGAESGGEPAVGFDRSALDPAMLDLARAAGVEVCTGATAREVALGDHRHGTVIRYGTDDGEAAIAARVVVGADGPRSIVATAAGMARAPRLAGRIGLTWHVADGPVEDGRHGAADAPVDAPKPARMVVLADGAYCGLAPVPGGRVNVGVVLAGRAWRERLVRDGAAATGEHALRSVPPLPGDPEAWREGRVTDAIAGASPLGSRVARRAGPDWLLVGDAAGFLDPFTGEGLHRALVSARLAADAVDAHLRGGGEVAAYNRAMADRFATKDVVSLLVQAFLARPRLFEHVARRLARREPVRATMGLVMGDLAPASRALDPRFLAGLLVP